ncbi:UNVERIFIED_CONTAM: hypothetical protein GTU68_019379, partial [Idotea baltica]|nr:hypothetical protein [Idotea baltica]
MPWMETNKAEQRRDFVFLASKPGANRRELIRRFGISAPTAYKWLNRYESEGLRGLEDRSRRPIGQPGKSRPDVERKIVDLRLKYDCWGARKLRRLLENAGETNLPSATTVHNIIRRNGLLSERKLPCVASQSFERSSPNELWQMDFKGHFRMAGSKRCHPLTACDDHSRFNLILKACEDERTGTVKDCMVSCFGKYGLPWTILCDNGSPWGRSDGMASALELWLLRLGVDMIHGRPRHPQTQGKEERFHQTLKHELLSKTTLWRDSEHCDRAFADFRELYNHVRPHRSLGLDCPADRYRVSRRSLPSAVPDCLSFYADAELVRKVKTKGEIMFRNRTFSIGRAFVGESLAINQFDEQRWEVFYCWKSLGMIDLSQ